jgi:OOP family OmpA-OmpF porin
LAVVAAVLGGWGIVTAQERDAWQVPPWTVGAGIGYMGFNSDAALKGGSMWAGHADRNFNNSFSAELSLYLASGLKGNDSADEEDASESRIVKSWTTALALDGLYHFNRAGALDPYLALGMGVNYFDSKVLDGSFDFAFRLGGGLGFWLGDQWTLRWDARALLPTDAEVSYLTDLCLVYDFGATPKRYVPVKKAVPARTTPPRSTYSPPPRTYSRPTPTPSTTATPSTSHSAAPLPILPAPTPTPTAPAVKAVSPRTDAQRIELNLQFAMNSIRMDPRYFPALDNIGRILTKTPLATARIEGHTDWTQGSDAAFNRKLSQERAEAVVEYLVDVHQIKRSRLTAVGQGFDRPKMPNDPKRGNPANRRVEVIISGLSDAP